MKCYSASDLKCSDRVTDSYLEINNLGYYKNIDKTLITKRESGRLDYQIIYISQGYGNFLIAGQMVRVNQGNIVLIYPGEKNYYEFPANNSSYYWIHFTGTGASSLLKKLNMTNHVYAVGDFYEFKSFFDQMSKSTIAKDFTTDIYLSASMQTLLALTSKKIYIPDSPIHRVIELIQKGNMNTMSNAEYAKMCNLSEAHFIRKFKTITGKTPHQYKVGIVISKAIEMLTTTTLNISETAYALGFEDSLYFSRLFKKEVGISPQNYLKKSCENINISSKKD